jgi:hypothetical protein
VIRSAIISDCGTWRWSLFRDLEIPGKTAMIAGVNPSKADGQIDDATIRKDVGFSARLGIGRFIKVNKFAFRATDVRELRTAADPVGPENDLYIRDAMRRADIHIACWGPLSKLPPNLRNRWRRFVEIAREEGVTLMCWGTAQDGHPRHPLMLAYDTPLVAWNPPLSPPQQPASPPVAHPRDHAAAPGENPLVSPGNNFNDGE